MKGLPDIILETANFHGGDVSQLRKAINTFSRLDYPCLGIKFHAFKPDHVALSDFSWYSIVKNFFIEEDQWRDIIHLAKKKNFKIWLDLFCVYGVEILEKNLSKIFGIKLQPSILDNLEVINALKKLDLSEKELIINISGFELSKIEDYLGSFKKYKFKKIILQMGFQNHPTKIEDSSFKKIDILKAAYANFDLSYADHISAEDNFAQNHPVFAYLKGCNYIEKHICNSRKETEYDVSAALEYKEIEKVISEIEKVYQCATAGFITENEKKYFNKSIQKPVLKKKLNRGQLVSTKEIFFRRTDKPGMNFKEWKELQNRYYILNKSKAKLDTLSFNDFHKTKIAAIVACRMKSSRLKQKAILPIRGMSSIERCLDNCFKMPLIDDVILATSTTEEDKVLSQYVLAEKAKFWQGDPEDVISRYLGACDEYNIDVVIRVTGDCPVVSPEIAGFLLESHFTAGADFTESRQFAVGSNSQIYNVEALRRVIELVGSADYSEHMTLYMINNPDIFKVNIVDLPPDLIRDYRLTLDYQEDLDMFNELYKKLEEQHLDATLLNVFKVLDENPDIPKINAHKTLVYKTDKALIKLLNEKTTINHRG